MGSSAKRKREKKQDFQKTKLKVGKTRPKNTNSTNTNFAAKSIILKQQTLSDGTRDIFTQFKHNLSLLTSKNEGQRKDALTHLTSAIAVTDSSNLPQPASIILSRTQPLILDASPAVRNQALKLLRTLPSTASLGRLDQALLYARAGLTHLSADIRLSALDAFEWLLDCAGVELLGIAGGWLRTLLTFQTLLGWHHVGDGTRKDEDRGTWRSSTMTTMTTNIAKSAGSGASTGNSRLLVRQLGVLAKVLAVGLARNEAKIRDWDRKAAAKFPLWASEAYSLPAKSNAFGYLNLFGVSRDMEGEVYDNPDERREVFVELGINLSFAQGVKEAKKEGGEVGRAAAMVEKALKLVGDG